MLARQGSSEAGQAERRPGAARFPVPGLSISWLVVRLRFHSPLRGAAVGDENWVPPVAGGVRAGGGWGLCLVLQAAGGVEGALWCWCAVRRHRERADRLWPRLRLVLEPLAG